VEAALVVSKEPLTLEWMVRPVIAELTQMESVLRLVAQVVTEEAVVDQVQIITTAVLLVEDGSPMGNIPVEEVPLGTIVHREELQLSVVVKEVKVPIIMAPMVVLVPVLVRISAEVVAVATLAVLLVINLLVGMKMAVEEVVLIILEAMTLAHRV
jgi:hypothetical protein